MKTSSDKKSFLASRGASSFFFSLSLCVGYRWFGVIDILLSRQLCAVACIVFTGQSRSATATRSNRGALVVVVVGAVVVVIVAVVAVGVVVVAEFAF